MPEKLKHTFSQTTTFEVKEYLLCRRIKTYFLGQNINKNFKV